MIPGLLLYKDINCFGNTTITIIANKAIATQAISLILTVSFTLRYSFEPKYWAVEIIYWISNQLIN